MANITIKDLASYTNISKSTISRALRNPETVSSEKLQVIHKAIGELGYIPNYFASNLKSNTNCNIGFIVNDVQNPFFNKLIQSIEKTLEKENYRLLISFSLPDQKSIDEKVNNVLFSPISGLMFSPDSGSEEMQKKLLAKGIYVLQLFTNVYGSFDSIVVNDFYGTYLATQRLIHSGHTNILLIGFNNLVFRERIAGYKQAYADFRIPLNESNIFLLDNVEFIKDQISTKILSAKPTAVISIGDIVGINTVKGLRQLNLRIPEDISMIHYDDSTWADLLNITTIGHPIDLLGRYTAEILISGIQNSRKARNIHQKIDPIIIERNSVKNIAVS
jgi:LacI family transcriptional regulator